MRRWGPWMVVGAAAVLLLAPLNPSFVERWYSSGVYPRFQPWVTAASNVTPWALFDVLLLATVAGVVAVAVTTVRAARRGRVLRAAVSGLLRLLTMGAVLYLWFLLAWGLNYRRVPLLERLELRTGAASADAVRTLATQTVAQLNALHDEAHGGGWAAEPWRDPRLRFAYERTQRLLSDAPAAVPGRLKQSLTGVYFRWASVDGMVDPFALEVLANPDLLPFERPFVAAHEWAHLAGYADESEASFVGWLTCMRAGSGAQSSGWLFLYWELSGSIDPSERKSLDAALAAGVRADLEQIAARVRRGQLPELRRASWAAYDQYLKANRVREGVRSYDAVVTLLVRARFEDGWVPVRAGANR